MDTASGKVFWSFSTGAPIYSSYEAPFDHDKDKENGSGPTTGFSVDYEDDWQLYLRGTTGVVCLKSKKLIT